jgi:hypothetical protein
MRRALTLLAVLAGCGATEPEAITIQVQGTVTAAADGSPIPDAAVSVEHIWGRDHGFYGSTSTDEQGQYSLSWVEKGFCPERLFEITASKIGFHEVGISQTAIALERVPSWAQPVRCTEDIQTIDFRLTALTPTPGYYEGYRNGTTIISFTVGSDGGQIEPGLKFEFQVNCEYCSDSVTHLVHSSIGIMDASFSYDDSSFSISGTLHESETSFSGWAEITLSPLSGCGGCPTGQGRAWRAGWVSAAPPALGRGSDAVGYSHHGTLPNRELVE